MRHLSELERELRAMRPDIDEKFAAKLDAWATEGFPAKGESPAPRPRRSWAARFRPSLPRLAFAACMIVLVGTVSVAVVGQETGNDDSGGLSSSDSPGLSVEADDSATGGAAGKDLSGEDAPSSGSVIAPEPTVPVPPRQDQFKPGEDREVERTASMRLSTEPDDVADVADGVVEVTERYDGIVARSNVETQSGRGRATFDLRIPAQNLQATLADLSDLASVAERDESTLDVTAPFVSAEERFADAKAEVDALVEQLGEASSADEIADIRFQLQGARAELASARSELADLKQRTDYSKLAVTVTGDGDADGWSLGDAVDDALSVLEDIGGAALVALAVIVPLGLIGGAVWFGYGAARRKSRERALDE